MLRTLVRRLCTMKPISDFAISPETLSKLKGLGIKELFPVQAQTFQHIKNGKDVVAQARTGSGKTIAFALPIIEKIQEEDLDRLNKSGRKPLVLTLAPTRELANQTATVFNSLISYGGLTVLPVYGGTSYFAQEDALRNGVDIIVGAPGRINDLLERGSLKLNKVRHIILDEVDRMLDMGFLDDVDKIMNHVYQGKKDEESRQTLMFSATLPPWIIQTSKRFLNKDNIEMVKCVDENRIPESIDHLMLMCPASSQSNIIRDLIAYYTKGATDDRVIVFCERKTQADALADSSKIPRCQVLHGDITQSKRELVLKRFRDGRCQVLITTDVAARGLDIPEVNLVIQSSPPKDTDSYIHRSGRTGRAGRSGTNIVLYNSKERALIEKIRYRVGIKFKSVSPPSTKELALATQESIVESLKSIPDNAIKAHFSSAKHIIDEMGAERAVAAALARILNRTEQSSSVLSGREGHTAMIFEFEVPFSPNKSFLYHIVQKFVGQEFESAISFVQFVEGRKGIVFDLSNDVLLRFESHWHDGPRYNIRRLEEIPTLEEMTENPDKSRNFHKTFGNRPRFAASSRQFGKYEGSEKAKRPRNGDFSNERSNKKGRFEPDDF